MKGWRVVLELGRLWVWFIWVCYVFSNSVYKTKKILNYKKRGKKEKLLLQGKVKKSGLFLLRQRHFCAVFPAQHSTPFGNRRAVKLTYPSYLFTSHEPSPGNWHLLKLRKKPDTECSLYWPSHGQICLRIAYVDCWDDTSNTDPKACSFSFSRIRPHLPRANETQNCRCPHS